MLNVRFLCAFAGAVVGSSLGYAQEARVEVNEGFVARDLFHFDPSAPFERQIGGLAYSPGGEPIVYENGEIRLGRGTDARVLAVFDPPVFGDFLELGPDGGAVYFGESSRGSIYRVPLDGSGPVEVDRLPLNFDLAFAPPSAPPSIRGRGFISGKVGFGDPANTVRLLDGDPETESPAVIIDIPGFSGPIAFDPEGNLYVGTAGADFTPFGETGERLVRFAPELLERALGGEPVGFDEGEVVLSEIGNLFNLEWLDGKLYFTNLGLGICGGSIQVVDPAENFRLETFARFPLGDCTASPSHLAAFAGPLPFAPGSGRRGGSLIVAYSDFATVSAVAEIVPVLYFVRGRINPDDQVDISDAVALLGWLFQGGPGPEVEEAADVNADGEVDLSDAIYLLDYLFRGGPAPPPPFPDPGPAL